MIAPDQTFVAKCLSGESGPEQVDDAIDAWHEAPGGFCVQLNTYLGLTIVEYTLWQQCQTTMEDLLRARGWTGYPDKNKGANGCCRKG